MSLLSCHLVLRSPTLAWYCHNNDIYATVLKMILHSRKTLEGSILMFLCASWGIKVINAAPEERNVSKITLLDKYRCASNNFADSTTVYSSSEVPSSHQTPSIRLSCSSESIIFKNVTVGEFHTIEYNGELYSSDRKFTFNTFCIISETSSLFSHSHASVDPSATLKLALCDEHVHGQNVAPSSIQSSRTSATIFRKCCLPNERLSIEGTHDNGRIDYVCSGIPTDAKQREWKPAIFTSTSDDYSQHKDLEDLKDATYKYGFPQCSTRRTLNNSRDIWFMLLESGSVQIGMKFWFKPVWLPVEDNEFCLDEVVDHDPSLRNKTEIDSHKIYHKNQILLYCQIAHFDDYLFHRKLFGGMCVTAAGIVFILLIIYVAIWDKQNLAGWTQFNIFVALFFVVLMEGMRTLLDSNALKVQSTPACVIIAAVAQYFFFALNTTWTVMCFDLFYMFYKLETTSKTVARYRNRLICYLTFSWGLPLVVVCVAFYLSHSNATEEMEKMKGIYAFAHRRCSSPIRKLGFQTQGIMFLTNLLFFLLTTGLLWRHRRGLNPVRRKSRNERHTWRSVTLFMKLVVVMGVTSLTIPVDYFFGSSDPLSATAVGFRMIHFIPFVAVLFIFGFNEKNVALVSQKYPRFGKYFGFVACTSGKASTSDTGNHSRSANRMSDHPSSPT